MRKLICLVLVLLTACTDGFTVFPVTEEDQRVIVEDVTIVRLDETNISSFTRPRRSPQPTRLSSSTAWEYRVGQGDILSIIVFDHPELTLPSGPQRSAAESGFSVQADGTFFYPFIKQVRASGRTIQDIREDVATRLADFIPDPQVEVRVAEFNSQSVNVTGEVKSPNRQALKSVPLTMVEAISAAGGFTETADPAEVTLQRGGKIYDVDVTGFLERGFRANNPVLRNGDIVTVPRRKVREAYLLGQIVKPATIDLARETITLTQAVTRQGGLNEVRADARGIFVFRATEGKMTVFQLETSSPTGLLLGTRFVIEPGDVIYVTRSPLQRWNDTISRLLPTVQAANLVENVVR